MPTTSPSEAKLAGLRQVLARDGRAVFKATGAVVSRDPKWPADLLVDRPRFERRRVNEWAHDQLAQAYALAHDSPLPKMRRAAASKPTRSTTDFGDDPPF